ncbi:MAG: DUF2796 domain-containing protein [bacterium]|nr:DUF2796 domain-containing protein [bacterium]
MRRTEQIKFSCLLLAGAIGLFASPGYSSAEGEDPHARHQEAHVHGEAELSMIFNENIVQFELKSPAANLFGFEHAPRNDEQRVVVRAVEKSLRDAAELFVFEPQSSCKSVQVELELPFSKSSTDNEAHEDESEHSNISARYQFVCNSGETLKAIDLKNLFINYPRLEKLESQWVIENSQGAAILGPGKSTIDINTQ